MEEEAHPPPPPPHPLVTAWATMMVRVVLPVFPAASTFVYVSVYVPAVVVFTEPELAVLIVPVPSILSDQVAPGSVYVEP